MVCKYSSGINIPFLRGMCFEAFSKVSLIELSFNYLLCSQLKTSLFMDFLLYVSFPYSCWCSLQHPNKLFPIFSWILVSAFPLEAMKTKESMIFLLRFYQIKEFPFYFLLVKVFFFSFPMNGC